MINFETWTFWFMYCFYRTRMFLHKSWYILTAPDISREWLAGYKIVCITHKEEDEVHPPAEILAIAHCMGMTTEEALKTFGKEEDE